MLAKQQSMRRCEQEVVELEPQLAAATTQGSASASTHPTPNAAGADDAGETDDDQKSATVAFGDR